MPISTNRFTRSIVFAPPMVKFFASSCVTPDDEFCPVSTLLKNCWMEVCAVEAAEIVSCWKINRTATRAKSTTSSVTVNVEVGVAVVLVVVPGVVLELTGLEVIVGVDDVVVSDVGYPVGDVRLELLAVIVVANIVEPEIVVGELNVVITKVPENPPVPSGFSTVKVMSISGATLRVIGISAAATAAFTRSASEVPSVTSLSASCVRRNCPSKVTKAFSVLQDRFSWLNLDCMIVATRGMEKLAWASAISRGIAWPMVTLLILVSAVLIDVVVQPCDVGIVQSTPVNPFEQIHEQTPSRTTFVPPLAQFNCDSHSEMAGCAALFSLALSMTRNLTGTTIAAAMIHIKIMSNTKKVHMGSPQQRRPFFCGPCSLSSAADSVSIGGPRKDLRPKGHAVETLLCRAPARLAGGGKAASMSERPD